MRRADLALLVLAAALLFAPAQPAGSRRLPRDRTTLGGRLGSLSVQAWARGR